MVKVFVPNPCSHRGRPIEFAEDHSAEMELEVLAEMRAHGVREWTAEDEISSDKGDANDPENMSRKELLALLKGKGAGNITLMTTDELRRLAAKVLAGESIAEETSEGEAEKPARADGGE